MSRRHNVDTIVQYPTRLLHCLPYDVDGKNYKVPLIQGGILLGKLDPLSYCREGSRRLPLAVMRNLLVLSLI